HRARAAGSDREDPSLTYAWVHRPQPVRRPRTPGRLRRHPPGPTGPARRPLQPAPPLLRRRPLPRHALARRGRVEPRGDRLPAAGGRPAGGSAGPGPGDAAAAAGPEPRAPDAPGDPRPLARGPAAARRLAVAHPEALLRVGPARPHRRGEQGEGLSLRPGLDRGEVIRGGGGRVGGGAMVSRVLTE